MSEEDVPVLSNKKNVMRMKLNFHYMLYINVNEVVNDEKVLPLQILSFMCVLSVRFKVRNTDVKLRKCVFPDERRIDVYPHYSYTACLVECRKNLQKNLCNCLHNNIRNLGSCYLLLRFLNVVNEGV